MRKMTLYKQIWIIKKNPKFLSEVDRHKGLNINSKTKGRIEYTQRTPKPNEVYQSLIVYALHFGCTLGRKF